MGGRKECSQGALRPDMGFEANHAEKMLSRGQESPGDKGKPQWGPREEGSGHLL